MLEFHGHGNLVPNDPDATGMGLEKNYPTFYHKLITKNTFMVNIPYLEYIRVFYPSDFFFEVP